MVLIYTVFLCLGLVVCLILGRLLIVLVKKSLRRIKFRDRLQPIVIAGFVSGIFSIVCLLVLLFYGIAGSRSLIFLIINVPWAVSVFLVIVFSIVWFPSSLISGIIQRNYKVALYNIPISVGLFIFSLSFSGNFLYEKIITYKLLNNNIEYAQTCDFYRLALKKEWLLVLSAISKKQDCPLEILHDMAMNPTSGMFEKHDGGFYQFYGLNGVILFNVASNNNTPGDALVHLSKFDDKLLFDFTIKNHVKNFKIKKERDVFLKILHNIIASNPRTPHSVLSEFLDHNVCAQSRMTSDICYNIARNPSASASLLSVLSRKSGANELVAETIINHNNTPVDALKYYSKSDHKYIRNIALNRLGVVERR